MQIEICFDDCIRILTGELVVLESTREDELDIIIQKPVNEPVPKNREDFFEAIAQALDCISNI